MSAPMPSVPSATRLEALRVGRSRPRCSGSTAGCARPCPASGGRGARRGPAASLGRRPPVEPAHRRRRRIGASATWMWTPDAEVGGQAAHRVEGVVGEREAGVGADEARARRPGGSARSRPARPWRRRARCGRSPRSSTPPARRPRRTPRRSRRGCPRSRSARSGGRRSRWCRASSASSAPSRADHATMLEVERAVEPPPHQLEDLREVVGVRGGRGHAAGEGRVEVVVRRPDPA